MRLFGLFAAGSEEPGVATVNSEGYFLRSFAFCEVGRVRKGVYVVCWFEEEGDNRFRWSFRLLDEIRYGSALMGA